MILFGRGGHSRGWLPIRWIGGDVQFVDSTRKDWNFVLLLLTILSFIISLCVLDLKFWSLHFSVASNSVELSGFSLYICCV